MARIISLINHKGGVGKTTTTLNLGKALSILGNKVLVIDADPQANLTTFLGVSNVKENIYDTICEDKDLPILKIDDNFYLVPSDLNLSTVELNMQSGIAGYFKLRDALKPHLSDFDYILIDCPPSLGILTHNALLASNEYLIIIQCQFMSIGGLSTIQTLINSLSSTLNITWKFTGVVLTQTNHTVSSKSLAKNMIEVFKDKVFKTQIRQNVSLVESAGAFTDIFNYNPNSTGAEDYMNLAKEI